MPFCALAAAQGLLQLGFVFMQASTITLSMGVIQLLQAARRYVLVLGRGGKRHFSGCLVPLCSHVVISSGSAVLLGCAAHCAMQNRLRRLPLRCVPSLLLQS